MRLHGPDRSRPILVVLSITIGFAVVAATLIRRHNEPEVWARNCATCGRPDIARHLDPAICHARWCAWTPRHPEDCDCPEWPAA